MNALSLSPQGLGLLKSIETLALKPYDDQSGNVIHQWLPGATIGYGHLISEAQWPLYADGLNVAGAEALFKSDLAPFEQAVNRLVTRTLTQYKFDALVILMYNIGIGAFSSSSVLKLVNDPATPTPYADLEEAWKAWDKSQGKFNQGLANRRAAEWNLYSKGIYQRW
ncbi:lysozyme [Gallaecimonas pentaromativorans]|uniref:lysozyme n=1 Tax=Gallaecimonas pentaromativorans TaxID=584787 RepID=UPI003A8EE54D